MSDALKSLEAYGRYVADLIERFAVKRSTVTVWSISKYTGVVEGEIFLEDGYRLRIREEIDFAAGLIVSYGYEAYQGGENGFTGTMIFHILTTPPWQKHTRTTNTSHPISSKTACPRQT